MTKLEAKYQLHTYCTMKLLEVILKRNNNNLVQWHLFQSSLVYVRPADKIWVLTPQTSLKFLDQNLFGDQFWGQSEAGKVWPQAILGPGAMGLTGGLPLDLK